MNERDSVERVDALVIGSGFGGSVSVYRLAAAGFSTVLLERGRPYPPGSFARGPAQMSRAFWEPKDELYGLYDVRSFRKLEALVSAGLGGGSLIYANVLMRKDEKWFVKDSPIPGGGYENWPISRADLEPHYDAVEKMMTPTVSPYPELAKSRALRRAGEALGLQVFQPMLAITFAPTPGSRPAPKQVIPTAEYGSIHDRTRMTCRLCGECDIGCNDGSKNTLDHNYLSAAKHHGADIRPHCQAIGIEPLDAGGYQVRYIEYGDHPPDGPRERRQRLIQADRVFLAAGTLGTVDLLLHNRLNLPALSRALGTRFCGNGDLETFAMGARQERDSSKPWLIDGSNGPVITTSIRIPDAHDGDPKYGSGFYIQEAGYPEFVDWLVEASQLGSSMKRTAQMVRQSLVNRLGGYNESRISAEISRLIGQGRLGSSSLPLLGMGRDVPDGRILLRDGEIDIHWSTATSMQYFTRLRETMRALSDQLNANFYDNPLWWTKRVITVHPLGGAPMGRNPHEGLIDVQGEVFGHPGLFVVDGAAMPGPVGANPAFTIAANADRIVEHALDAPRSGRRSVPRLVVEEPAAPADPVPGNSVEFTEEMKGFLTLGESDPESGWTQARMLQQRFSFKLTISIPDVEQFLVDPERTGVAKGWVKCQLLGGQLQVERGWFNLFVDTDDVNTREMRYRLWFRDMTGRPLTLHGFKTVRDDPGLDIWRDTSTLYVTLLDGHLPPRASGDAVGAGVLRILPGDFARQLTTFRADGGKPLQSLGRFATYFGRSLSDTYAPVRRRPR